MLSLGSWDYLTESMKTKKNRSKPSTCLIDNWSLECAAVLLEEGVESIKQEILKEYLDAVTESTLFGVDLASNIEKTAYSTDVYFGSLANLLTALVLFDEVLFINNGFEASWQRFPNFANQLINILHGTEWSDPSTKELEREFGKSIDPGLAYYCYLAKVINTDVLLNPLRAQNILEAVKDEKLSYGQFAFDLLNTLDVALQEKILSFSSQILQRGIVPNLTIPAIASLVYSIAPSKDKILETVIELRNSSGARDLRKTLQKCVGDLRASTNYPALVEDALEAVNKAIKKMGGFDSEETLGSAGFNLFFFSYAYDIPKPVESYVLFMRDVAKCRLELSGARLNIKRLFSYTLDSSYG